MKIKGGGVEVDVNGTERINCLDGKFFFAILIGHHYEVV
jgi:hypothetical protein